MKILTKLLKFMILPVFMICLFSCNHKNNLPLDNNDIEALPITIIKQIDETDEYCDFFKSDADLLSPKFIALSSFMAVDLFVSKKQINDKLTKEGFTDIFYIHNEDDPYGVSYAIARRISTNGEIILVSVQGYDYYEEWISNFSAGLNGDIKGFAINRDQIISKIDEYLEEYQITDYRLWLCGYSRGGSIANLLGVYFNENLNKYGLKQDDIFTYTFNAPRSSISDIKYLNIVNCYNENDGLNIVYPASWQIYLNGIPYIIEETTQINVYYGLDVKEGSLTDANLFTNEFFTWFTRRIDRKTYATKIEPALISLLTYYFNLSGVKQYQVSNFLENVIEHYVENLDKLPYRMLSLVKLVLAYRSSYLAKQLIELILLELEEEVNNSEFFTEDEWTMIKEQITILFVTLLPVIVDDYYYSDGIDYDFYYNYIIDNYDLDDAPRGNYDGTQSGFSIGYYDGLHSTNSKMGQIPTTFGNQYVINYLKAYRNAYDEGYNLGLACQTDLAARGMHDALNNAKKDGLNDGFKQKEKITFDENLKIKDWMNDDYLNSYQKTYLEEYLKYYELAFNYTNKIGEDMPFYHLLTIYYNFEFFYDHHEPFNNYELINNN